MSTAQSRTFKNGNGEAVHIPQDLAFGPDVDVTLVRSGNVLTIYPTRGSMAELIRDLRTMPRPASIGVRDEIEIPERDGL